MRDDLVDRIYEAAFVPELWPDVLDSLSVAAASLGTVMFTMSPRHVARWTASESVRDAFTAFITDPDAPPPRAVIKNSYGFLRDVDVVAPEAFASDPLQAWLRANGLGWNAGTTMPMPTGEVVVYSLDRRFADGPHPAAVIDTLNALRPDLARAALIAARLGLERARATVATLEALQLPAAVLTASARVLAVNPLLEAAPEVVPAAHGRLALAHGPANRLLHDALDLTGTAAGARSIALPASVPRGPGILHVLPLRGAAHDVLGGTTLVVLTRVSMDGNVPSLALLTGLFDLTPREAAIAASLAAGHSLKDAAQEADVRIATARSYLESIFAKTGTNQQSQLVALLKGARLLPPS